MTVINHHGTTWEELKAIRPRGPVPVNPEEPSKNRKRRCPHTRKHHTAAGDCRKCDRHQRREVKLVKRFKKFS